MKKKLKTVWSVHQNYNQRIKFMFARRVHVFWIRNSFCKKQQQKKYEIDEHFAYQWMVLTAKSFMLKCSSNDLKGSINSSVWRNLSFDCITVPFKIIFTMIATRKIMRRFINEFSVKSSWRCVTRFKELSQKLYRNFTICYHILSVSTCEGARLLLNFLSFVTLYGHVNDIIIIFFFSIFLSARLF